MNNEISMPVAKAASALGAVVVANSDVVEGVVRVAVATSGYETWAFFNSIPWGPISFFVATLYSCLLMSEWWWKKLWRPLLESRGWIKPLRHRIITVEEYEATETEKAAEPDKVVP